MTVASIIENAKFRKARLHPNSAVRWSAPFVLSICHAEDLRLPQECDFTRMTRRYPLCSMYLASPRTTIDMG